jgi:site-specific DNA recombinase
VVWAEVVRLLENPSLIQNELDPGLAAARTADPARQRENTLQRDVARTRKSIDCLLTAYREVLLSLDDLRRTPKLRQREPALQAELQGILDQVNDRAVYLRLAETLSAFLARLAPSTFRNDKSGAPEDQSYLLRSGRHHPTARQPLYEPLPPALAKPGPR